MSRPYKTAHDEFSWTPPLVATTAQKKVYGVYTFFLLHGDGSKKQNRKIDNLEKLLCRSGLFGRWVDNIPEAKETYTKLIRKFGVKSQVSGIE